jgi:signal transduction histidine kinase
MRLNIYEVVNGINAALSLSIAVIIFFRKGNKPLHLTYAFFSLLLFSWTFSYLLWGLQSDLHNSLIWLQILEFPVCFIHTAYYHFSLIFTDKVKINKTNLILAYASSVFFFFINTKNGFFDLTYIRNRDPFIFCPHATPALLFFNIIEAYFLGLSFYSLIKSIKESTEPAKIRYKYFLIVGLIGWLGGLTNWFYFYDATPIPPIGNPGVTIYLLGVYYLIFKHDILQLNMVVKKTFLYSLLTLFILNIYILFIIFSEKLFRSFFGYSSFIATALASLTIAVLFNPIRNLLSKFIDKYFFGKNIIELSEENQRMLLELREQDRLKAVATFAAGTAHEIKNPLAVIKTFTDHLAEKYDDVDFREKFVRLLPNEVERMNNIVKQLLDFSKPRGAVFTTCSVREIQEDTLQLIDANFSKNNISLIKNIQHGGEIIGDKNHLKQAFLNILMNSIQSMPNGGLVEINAHRLEKDFLVSFKDTGSGIAKKDLPHIFEPFFSKKENGTGLGLSIVSGIIARHGGSIEVLSTEGKGTTFNVILRN